MANAQVYRKRHRDAVPIDVIEADAAEYEIRPDENVFYMYHPFGPDVIRQVVLNIRSSVARRSRPVWIVYCRPMYCDVIENRSDEAGVPGAFARVRTYRYALKEFAVYTMRHIGGVKAEGQTAEGLTLTAHRFSQSALLDPEWARGQSRIDA